MNSITINLMDALKCASAAHRVNGFIKAGKGYFDSATSIRVHDSRMTVRNMLDFPGNSEYQDISVTPADEEMAQKIYDYFDNIMVLEKITGIHEFEFNAKLAKIFKAGTVDQNKELAIVSSLPNSYALVKVREQLDAFYAARKDTSTYYGIIGNREKVTVNVVNVKFVPRSKLFLVTTVTDDDNIIKFFTNSATGPEIQELVGNKADILGHVKKHSTNQHTGCKETLLKHVTICQ